MGKAPRNKTLSYGQWSNDGIYLRYSPYGIECTSKIVVVSTSSIAPAMTGNRPSKIGWSGDFYIYEGVVGKLASDISEGSTILIIDNHHRSNEHLSSAAVGRLSNIVYSLACSGVSVYLISSANYSPKWKLFDIFVEENLGGEYEEMVVVGCDFYGGEVEEERNNITLSEHVISSPHGVRGVDYDMFLECDSDFYYTAEQYFGCESYRDHIYGGKTIILLLSPLEEDRNQIVEYCESMGYIPMARDTFRKKVRGKNLKVLEEGNPIVVVDNVPKSDQRKSWVSIAEDYGYEVITLINYRYGQFYRAGDSSGDNTSKIFDHSKDFEFPSETEVRYFNWID